MISHIGNWDSFKRLRASFVNHFGIIARFFDCCRTFRPSQEEGRGADTCLGGFANINALKWQHRLGLVALVSQCWRRSSIISACYCWSLIHLTSIWKVIHFIQSIFRKDTFFNSDKHAETLELMRVSVSRFVSRSWSWDVTLVSRHLFGDRTWVEALIYSRCVMIVNIRHVQYLLTLADHFAHISITSHMIGSNRNLWNVQIISNFVCPVLNFSWNHFVILVQASVDEQGSTKSIKYFGVTLTDCEGFFLSLFIDVRDRLFVYFVTTWLWLFTLQSYLTVSFEYVWFGYICSHFTKPKLVWFGPVLQVALKLSSRLTKASTGLWHIRGSPLFVPFYCCLSLSSFTLLSNSWVYVETG